ncbi:class I SAM-dependent methyltransferase [Chloroflexota bacterium]
MDTLSAVSETALITLKAHVVESESANPVIEDVVAIECLNRLRSMLPVEIRDRVLNRKLPSTATRHIALRARKYDSYARGFIEENPDGMVVSLGCGFDTRYWRVSKEPWKYIEVDLPDVVEAKKKVLGDIAKYEMLGESVLEESLINYIASLQKEHVLFLAEGLFMYLPKDGVISLFKRLSESFVKSQIVFEVVNEKYTKGIWKKIVESKMRRSLGIQAGSSYDFGVHDAKDIEAFGNNIKVVDEWSYLEDEDIKPKVLRLFRNIKLMSRIQWTIKATIG